MHIVKRVALVVLIILLLFCLVACSSNKHTNTILNEALENNTIEVVDDYAKTVIEETDKKTEGLEEKTDEPKTDIETNSEQPQTDIKGSEPKGENNATSNEKENKEQVNDDVIPETNPSNGNINVSESIIDTSTSNNSFEEREAQFRKDYETAKQIAGYYWYFDGCETSYLKCEIIPWFDHEALFWDSSGVLYENGRLIALKERDTNGKQADSSSVHNRLLCNPIGYDDNKEHFYGFINYSISVSGSKMTLTLDGKTYTLTRSAGKKQLNNYSIELIANQAGLNVGDIIPIRVIVRPYCDWIAIDYRGMELASNSIITNVQMRILESDNVYIDVIAQETINNTSRNATTKRFNFSVEKPPEPEPEVPEKIAVSGITLNTSNVNMVVGESVSLIAEVTPQDADDKSVLWTSSDESVATVDSNGTVKAIGTGNVIILATTNDGGFTSSCEVTVNYPKLTCRASVGLFTSASENTIINGVTVSLDASGGSGSYVTYEMTIYKDGTLIGMYNQKEIQLQVPNRSGVWTVEYKVVDSAGNEASGRTETTISISN